MIVGDCQHSESVGEHQIADLEAEAGDRRSPDLQVRRDVLDDRTSSRPLGDQTENLVNSFQELATEPRPLLVEPDSSASSSSSASAENSMGSVTERAWNGLAHAPRATVGPDPRRTTPAARVAELLGPRGTDSVGVVVLVSIEAREEISGELGAAIRRKGQSITQE